MNAKRFWDEVTLLRDPFRIALDGRVMNTPDKNELILPTEALANAIVLEWSKIEGEITQEKIPLTRYSNTAQDRVQENKEAIVAHILAYLGHDLICYRSDAPSKLAEKQTQWDVWLKWAQSWGVKLHTTNGISSIEQPKTSMDAGESWLLKLNPYQLLCMQEAVSLMGSFVLAAALVEFQENPKTLFDLSRIDEDFQAEIWGETEELQAERLYKKNELLNVDKLLRLM